MVVNMGDTAKFRIDFEAIKPVPDLTFTLRILTPKDDLAEDNDERPSPTSASRESRADSPGYKGTIEFELPNLKLRSGSFQLGSISTRSMTGRRTTYSTPTWICRCCLSGVAVAARAHRNDLPRSSIPAFRDRRFVFGFGNDQGQARLTSIERAGFVPGENTR